MANDSFSEALHRLKEIHDKEVIGMQAKLTELTMEKCRDSQRIEELFSKNHLLREQHKVLNENIKVLENRLRAGLCDRCTVTQELAKKKHQEYESCHLQNLQQISSLTKEINLLKEENKSLLEELRKVQCLDSERSRSRSNTPENNATPEDQRPSPIPTASLRNNTEKTRQERETGDNNQDHHASEETCVLRLSPVVKNVQIGSEVRQADMKTSGVQKVLLNSHHSQQKISNQLHGTIAVMRPGIKSGHPAALSPAHKRSSNDVHPRESRPDKSESPSPLDPLKHVMPEEQFNLLRQHFAQKRLAQLSGGNPNEGPIRYLVAKNNEVVLERRRSEEEWEDKSAMAELQGAVLYLREQGYKNRVTPANHREKIQYLLSKQNQGLRSPNSPGDAPKCLVRESSEEKELSLIQFLSARWRNSRNLNGQEEEQDWPEKETRSLEPEIRSPYEEEATPDKPLDLSDTRRGQHAATHSDIKQEHKYPPECHMPRPASRNNSSSPPSRAPNSKHLHTSPMEGCAMKPKSEPERGSEEAKQGAAMDHSRGTEATTEVRRPGQSHKRLRDSESDEQEEGHATDGESSHQDMDGELDTSGSEEEVENQQNSSAETSRDGYASEEKQGGSRWRKGRSQACKKSLQKKQKVAENEAGHGAGKDPERERPV